MKLLSVTESTHTDKKLMAVFMDTCPRSGKVCKKTTHFGAAGADDYTLTGDKEQRARYRQRHAKDLETNDPTRAGFLSYYILWGDSTSRAKNIADYRARFHM